jgi:predicted SAM-dependent methyltransferase
MSPSDDMFDEVPLVKLHIGGRTRTPGWTSFDIAPGPEVDLMGDCRDLSRFEDDSVDEIYASHILEHLSYRNEIVPALKEWYRVLLPGALVKISVPDFDVLCRLFVRPDLSPAERGEVLRMVFGGQMDEHDFHRAGLTFELLSMLLTMAGFAGIKRVGRLGDFDDTSRLELKGVPISLNITARKPLPPSGL